MRGGVLKNKSLPHITAYPYSPENGVAITLYLLVIDLTMSSVFVQETDKAKQTVYFLSRVFKGVDAC